MKGAPKEGKSKQHCPALGPNAETPCKRRKKKLVSNLWENRKDITRKGGAKFEKVKPRKFPHEKKIQAREKTKRKNLGKLGEQRYRFRKGPSEEAKTPAQKKKTGVRYISTEKGIKTKGSEWKKPPKNVWACPGGKTSETKEISTQKRREEQGGSRRSGKEEGKIE